MKEIKEENLIKVVNEYEKNISYDDIEFESYLKSDDFTASVKQLFYRDDSDFAQEYISEQNLLFDNNEYLFYQIPIRDRVYGIVKESISIEVGDYTIIDDGHGNLFEINDTDFEVQIGNIFYDTGCIFITTEDDFLNTGDDPIFYLQSNTVNLKFQKYVQFIEKSIILDISESDYLSTTNKTWDGETPLFFNKIYLYNDDYDVIAVGYLSRNVPFRKNITVILDMTEVY